MNRIQIRGVSTNMVRDWALGHQLGEGNLGEGSGVYKGPMAQTNTGSVQTKSTQGVSLVGPLHPFSPLASHLMFSSPLQRRLGQPFQPSSGLLSMLQTWAGSCLTTGTLERSLR